MTKRNCGLDFLKFICAFWVIHIHIPFPYPIGPALTTLARIAVPIFFMITGYYYSYIVEKDRETKQIKKNFSLFIGANILYFLYELIKIYITKESISSYLKELFELRTIFEFVLLNESPFSGHLWYLGAILYVLIVIWIFEKKRDRRLLYPIVPILLLGDLVLGKYSILLFGKSVNYIWIRNFVFVGLPYFLIGDMLFKFTLKIKKRILIMLISLFSVTTIFERIVLELLDKNAVRDHYLSTTFLAISVFLLALQYEEGINQPWFKLFAWIGGKMSVIIYVIHPICISILKEGIEIIVERESILVHLYRYLAPVLVLLISGLVAWCIVLGKRMWQRNILKT